MNHRHDDPTHDEHGRPVERSNWRAEQAQRDFYPGNHGFQESTQPGYGPGQHAHGPAAGAYAPGQYEGASSYPAQQGPWSNHSAGNPYRGEPRERSAQYGSEYPQYEPQYERVSDPQRRSGQADRGPYRGRGFSSFAQQSLGHAPYWHSAFGESNEPHYFGAGSQGYGGGPSFTGGTYGYADRRSDAPRFQEIGFNRGNYPEGPGGVGGFEYSNRPPMWGSSRERRRYRTGPKGYQRSDERLREDISERLMQADHIDSSEVTVQVLGGKVILEGTVPDRYMKHEIEDLAVSAPGVQDIENRIRVALAPATTGPERATGQQRRTDSGASEVDGR